MGLVWGLDSRHAADRPPLSMVVHACSTARYAARPLHKHIIITRCTRLARVFSSSDSSQDQDQVIITRGTRLAARMSAVLHQRWGRRSEKAQKLQGFI